ncbi:MAG TPA: hypothetical protein ENN38_03670 [Actinobacteria bacterium]|nr:hypothetical protein [Actinomycetota bacterium]
MGIRKLKVFFVLSFSIILLLVFSAYGLCAPSSKQKQAKDAKSQINNLQIQLNKAAREYDSAYGEYIETVSAEDKTKARLVTTEKEFETKKNVLNSRLKAIYTQEELSFLQVFMESVDFNDFLTRFYLYERIGAWDAKIIDETRNLKIELQQEKEELELRRSQQKALLKRLSKKQKELDKKFKETKGLLSNIEKDLRNAPRVSSRTIKGVRMSCFPVARPYAYSDSWLAPRKGHRHQGCDIFATRGTPCYACVSGIVKTSGSRNGGMTIYLHGDTGDNFYYMHLNGFAVSGGHVEAGQIIGSVGDTGNARGGACHLHFEVHPGGGRAVNPYPILRSIE